MGCKNDHVHLIKHAVLFIDACVSINVILEKFPSQKYESYVQPMEIENGQKWFIKARKNQQVGPCTVSEGCESGYGVFSKLIWQPDICIYTL